MISFDIFDTLITRKIYSPQGIFLLLHRKLLEQGDINNHLFNNQFFTLRIDAEREARFYAEQEGREEISHDEIYKILACRCNLSKEVSDRIKKWEIETERENIWPVRKNIELVKQFISQGERVVLISDMYLGVDAIRSFLLRFDSVFLDIPMYISSELKKTKQSGSLYFEVAKREKQVFPNWIHFGDNEISDYLMPRMLGIDAKRILPESLTSWEKELAAELGLKDDLTLQYYFGVARNVRMEKKLDCPGKIGSSIGGIILYPYVFWLLRRSREMGVKRLYFVARDGFILKKIADRVISNQHMGIKTSYIYGSRKAWRVKESNLYEKQMVIRYLTQEVDFSDSNFAFVDLHGTGATMESLADLVLEKFHIKMKVFYFDLMRNHVSDTYRFMPFCSEHSGMVELFCRAPHGATLGYEQAGDKLMPRLQFVDKACWERAGLYDYLEGVELFADSMSRSCKEYWLEDVRLPEKVLEYCGRTSSRELQNFLGKIPHCDGVEKENITYAPLLSAYDVFRLYMWRTVEDISQYYSGSNLTLSLMRSNQKYIKEKIFLEKHYNSIIGKCIHRFKNKKRQCKGTDNIKVIIYGAGDMGKRLYGHLATTPGFQIAGWTDMNYEHYRKLKYPVITLLESLKKDFNYIIIAVRNQESCKQISTNLEGLGISKEKIVSYDVFLQKSKLIVHSR